MLFNSIDFAVFLPVVFLLYWFATNRNLRIQNLLIVIASYVFYGWWDYRFLSLMLFSTGVDYWVGLRLRATENLTIRKLLLCTSIVVNIGLLGFFKYYNFFLDNFVTAFSFLGTQLNPNTLDIILPVGISFYTFQTLSYTIDVYKGKLKPTSDFIGFAAFVSFFPQLVAGPIERATHLLPQFYHKRTFEYAKAVDGLRQILWGVFKKIAIADGCSGIVEQAFANSGDVNSSALVLGAVAFTFQIYADFSGYSDIAIGTARLFGFDLRQNFNFPYFSRDIAEFWRRWHISLSTWFRDYLYIPLGGSRAGGGGTALKIRNIFIVFVVSGFWHGANWTFIIWGALNALYYLPLLLTSNNRTHLDTVASGKQLPSLKELSQMLLTFGMAVLGWIFFRAENVGHAFSYLTGIFSPTLFSIPDLHIPKLWVILLGLFLLLEWRGRNDSYALEKLGLTWKRPYRWAVYYSIIMMIFYNMNYQEQVFIYFQF